MNLVLGIDGGGTSCRAALATADGDVIGRAKSGAGQHPHRPHRRPRQHRRGGAAGLRRRRAGPGADRRRRRPCLASPAANVGTYRQQLEAILPFSRSRVETDAADRARRRGRRRRRRHGHPRHRHRLYGAQATASRAPSAAGVFRSATRAAARASAATCSSRRCLPMTASAPASPLTAGDARASSATIREDVVEFTTNAKPGDFGGFAPKVFEHAAKGDAVAECDPRQGGRRCRGSLGALDLARRRSALPARRAGAALCAAAFRALPGAAEAAAAGCAGRRGGDGGAHLRQARRRRDG